MAEPQPNVVPTRVLRAGPPQGRKGILDVVVGVLGVLLLLAAGTLAVVLPEDPYIPAEYQVSVVDVQTDLDASQSFEFVEGSATTHEFKFDVPDNTYRIEFTVFFKDDLPASDPDTFRIRAYDPLGRPAVKETLLTNPLPTAVRVPTPPAVPMPGPSTDYVAIETGQVFRNSFYARPEDQVVAAAFEGEKPGQVRDRLMEELHIASAGTWTIEVTLVDAGDCPLPDPSPDNANRAAVCRQGAADDTGNVFLLSDFIYTTFDLGVGELEA